jgi:hypothetical protein
MLRNDRVYKWIETKPGTYSYISHKVKKSKNDHGGKKI